MLKIINNLHPFFEDCYRRINVREYAKIIHTSPPTASKLLTYYNSNGLLLKTTYKNYILFYANKNNTNFIDLSRIYWRCKLDEFIALIENKLVNPSLILFGSLSKAESKQESDIDMAIFANKKELNIKDIEQKLKRKIQLFWFKSLNDIKNKELANNIINGYTLVGRLKC